MVRIICSASDAFTMSPWFETVEGLPFDASEIGLRPGPINLDFTGGTDVPNSRGRLG